VATTLDALCHADQADEIHGLPHAERPGALQCSSFYTMPIVLSGLPSGILSQVCSRRRPIWLARGHGKYRRSEFARCIGLHHMTWNPCG
jgi:hypothetical protein